MRVSIRAASGFIGREDEGCPTRRRPQRDLLEAHVRESIEAHVLGDLLEIARVRFEGDDLSARAHAPREEQREDALVAADVEDGQATERQRLEKALLRALRAEPRDESEAAASAETAGEAVPDGVDVVRNQRLQA